MIVGCWHLLHLHNDQDQRAASPSAGAHCSKACILKGENEMFESVAKWPKEVSTGNDPNLSTDKHATEEQALSVCEALEREGLGGMRQIFPLVTYVREVKKD